MSGEFLHMPRSFVVIASLVLALPHVAASQPQQPRPAAPPAAQPDPFRFQMMGPAEGGRFSAISGVPGNPKVWYLGAASGGVWKSVDSGATFRRSRKAFPCKRSARSRSRRRSRRPCGSVPAKAWAIRDADLMGDGVYKSTDAGATWTNMGLAETGRIGGSSFIRRIRTSSTSARSGVRPASRRNAACTARSTVAGHGSSCSGWTRTSAAPGSRSTCKNPNMLFAGMWQMMMHTYAMYSGTHDVRDGICVTHDGGETWKEVARSGASEVAARQDRRRRRADELEARLRADPDRRPGIGVALGRRRREMEGRELAAPAHRPRRLLHQDQGLDGERERDSHREQQLLPLDGRRRDVRRRAVGRRQPRHLDRPEESRSHRTDERRRRAPVDRPHAHVPDCRRCRSARCITSPWTTECRTGYTRIDRTTARCAGRARRPRRRPAAGAAVAAAVVGAPRPIQRDAAVAVRRAGDEVRSRTTRAPGAAGARDAAAARGRSRFDRRRLHRRRRRRRGRSLRRHLDMGPRARRLRIRLHASRLTDPNIIWASCYGNEVTRYDHTTKRARSVSPWIHTLDSPPNTLKYRCHWTPPLAIDPFDHNTMYYGCQVIFKTSNGGQSWTRDQPRSLDERSEPHRLVGRHRRRQPRPVLRRSRLRDRAIGDPERADLGRHERRPALEHARRRHERGPTSRRTSPGSPRGARCGRSSRRSSTPARRTSAIDFHMMDNRKPFIYKTTDFGQTWTNITDGLPEKHPLDYVMSVAENPNRKGMLFAGTGHAFYYSLDDGAHWKQFKEGLPQTRGVVDRGAESRGTTSSCRRTAAACTSCKDIAPLERQGEIADADVDPLSAASRLSPIARRARGRSRSALKQASPRPAASGDPRLGRQSRAHAPVADARRT